MAKKMLILTLKYTKTAQNYQDKKTNNIKIVILKIIWQKNSINV